MSQHYQHDILVIGSGAAGLTLALSLPEPPNWLACVLSPDVAAGPLAWLSLALAGLGMGLFLRRLGLSGWAVAAGVVGVQAGGFGLENVFYF
jgi:2-polyprenyl-6-methoxyphenol hydroxylase-like FAD-dependent oxidoreductase